MCRRHVSLARGRQWARRVSGGLDGRPAEGKIEALIVLRHGLDGSLSDGRPRAADVISLELTEVLIICGQARAHSPRVRGGGSISPSVRREGAEADTINTMPFSIIPELLLAALGALGVPSLSSLFVNRQIKKEVDELGPEPQESVDSSGVPVGPLERDFQKMLRKYYGHGLSAARINLTTSVSFSVLGGVILLGGAGMAVWRAETTGEFYSAMVISVSGLVMSVVATLFHRRADKALAHLTDQTRNLRADMAVERDARQAVALLEKVQDQALKARLEAALILKFAQAEIPNLSGIGLQGISAAAGVKASVPAPASSN